MNPAYRRPFSAAILLIVAMPTSIASAQADHGFPADWKTTSRPGRIDVQFPDARAGELAFFTIANPTSSQNDWVAQLLEQSQWPDYRFIQLLQRAVSEDGISKGVAVMTFQNYRLGLGLTVYAGRSTDGQTLGLISIVDAEDAERLSRYLRTLGDALGRMLANPALLTERALLTESEPATVRPGPISPSLSASSAFNSYEIEEVIYTSTVLPNVAGGLLHFTTVYAFFKNGMVCDDCIDEWVVDPTLSQFRRDEPDDIGSWRRQSNEYQARFPGDDWDDLNGARPPPRPRGFKLNRSFSRSGGATISTTSTISVTSIQFNSDGTFESSSLGAVAGDDTAAHSIGQTRRGSYLIDGYSIEFRFDDSQVIKTSLVTFDNSPEMILIGEATYLDR